MTLENIGIGDIPAPMAPMTKERAGEIFLKSVINTLKTEKEITDPIAKADALEAFTRSMRDLAGISAEEAATLFEFMNNAAFHQ